MSTSGLKRFPETDDALDFVEADRAMRQRAHRVMNLGVGPELGAALLACPVLRCGHERGADAAPPDAWFDVPALQKRHAPRMAALGVRPDGQLREACDTSVRVLRD